jgi:hypothetical protein
MTCSHALDLIDIGPFADVPPAQLEAMRLHVRTCATCAKALHAAQTLDAGLRVLPQPAAPIELTAEVMARLARMETAEPPVAARARSAGASLAALAAGAALLLGLGLAGQAGPILHITAAGGPLPQTSGAALGFAAGLVLYVSGLFGSVRTRAGR